ncbi:MAG: hypothetical protein ACO4AJ_08005 [Prochlorothrix sp.]
MTDLPDSMDPAPDSSSESSSPPSPEWVQDTQSDNSSPEPRPSLPLVPILGAALLGGVALGGGYWLAARSLDRQVEQRLEQGMTRVIGATADCHRANGQFFSPKIQVQGCQINNLTGFSSPYLLRVEQIEIESQGLRQQPVTIDQLSLQDVALNLDIKADLSPQNLLNPKALLPINLGEALATISTIDPESRPNPELDIELSLESEVQPETNGNPGPEPSFRIQKLQIQNISVTLTLQSPLLNPSRQFQLDDIILTNVTSDTLETQIFAALREEVSAELQVMLGDEAAVLGKRALELLLPILRRSLEAYLLGLPF